MRLTDRGREAYAIAACLVTDLEETWAKLLGERGMQELKHLLAQLWNSIETKQQPDA